MNIESSELFKTLFNILYIRKINDVSIFGKLIDRLQSHSRHKTFKYDEQRSPSSSKIDSEVFSLSELNDLENCATGLRGTTDYLDLYTSDDAGDVCRNFQQDEYRESEQSSLHLTNNEAYFLITIIFN
ncbi:hypothetical protein AVEN_61837-1 [Araneus ventricosus]|uniref:Uncharacterized protein n=1 Tax=Araneus ventricosus TaxID=182803 RepID=A0A4Y2UMI6_ARAVE|nr:hypothetical protein AVEN_61837-1 [Araneus ventricosus]